MHLSGVSNVPNLNSGRRSQMVAKSFLGKLSGAVFAALVAALSDSVSAQHIVTGLGDGMAEVPQTITLQAYDTNGNAKTTGGDTFMISLSSNSEFPEAPGEWQLTDNGDGSYQTDLLLTQGGGEVTVSITETLGNGIIGEYYDNESFSGVPTTQIDSEINFDDVTFNSPFSQNTFVSVIWTSQIKVPNSGSYGFTIEADDQADITIGGNSATASQNNSGYLSLALEGGVYYNLRIEFSQTTSNVLCRLSMQGALMSAGYFYQVNTVTSQTINVARSTVPAQSTFEVAATSATAGIDYSVELQSRNSQGEDHSVSSDTYSLQMVHSDGSESQTRTASHTSDGLYSATFTPTIAGIHTLSADLTNAYTATDASIQTSISGSPQSITVYPGEVDPTQSYTLLAPSLPTQTAGVPFSYDIKFVDLWGNLHFQTMTDELDDGMTVLVEADYDNHDDWPSPIEVEDYPDWETEYGTKIVGSKVDQSNGRIKATFTISRAGDYSLTTKINDVDVANSPQSFLTVTPNALHAPSCVAVDIPLENYAGFKYDFLVQARDEFHNNIQLSLENAIGEDYSVFSTLIDDPTMSVEGLIVDAEDSDPGVYHVFINLPEEMTPGEYSVNVALSGQIVPSPLIQIYPCSNKQALLQDILNGYKKSETVIAPDYATDGGPAEIQLPTVALFCQTHQLISIFKSAKLENEDGSTREIEATGLENIGITIQPMGDNPLLIVDTEDSTLSGSKLSLILSATVVEEPDWETIVTVQINFFGKKLELVVRESFAAPLFDSDTVTESTLKMTEDDSGVQFLSPVFLICVSEWKKSLPGIKGEAGDVKFELSVDLDAASTILSYDPIKRVLELNSKAPSLGVSRGVFTIKIVIRDKVGLKSSYNLRVSYDSCIDDGNRLDPLNSFVPIYDKNPPTPSITLVDQYGQVKIRFNETMQFEQLLKEQQISLRKHLRLLPSEDEDSDAEIIGSVSQDFKNFSAIHSSLVMIDGKKHPSIEVSLVPTDLENTCSDFLSFNWELTEFSKQELSIQLYFETPSCVSSTSNQKDELVIRFHDQRLFIGDSNSMIRPGTVVRSKIVRQMPADGSTRTIVDSLTSTATAAVATTGVISLIFGVVLRGAMRRLLNVVKSLQIILHIMLIQISLVAHTETFLETLQGIVFANLYDRDGVLSIDSTDSEDQESSSSSPIGISSVSLVQICIPVGILTIYLWSEFCFCPKVKVFCKKQLDKTCFNRLIFFFDGSLLVFFIASVIVILKGDFDKGTAMLIDYHCSTVFVVISVPTIFIITGYLLSNFSKLDTAKYQEKVGAAYSPLRVDKGGRRVILYLFLSYARRVLLGLTVTLGNTSLIGQLLFVNYSSLLLFAVIALTRPFLVSGQNILQLANEAMILILFSHCITQTEFVQEPRGRELMGWSLNGLVIVNVVVNLSFILIRDGHAFYQKMRQLYYKRKAQRLLKEAAERKQKIDIYRESVLKDFQTEQAPLQKSIQGESEVSHSSVLESLSSDSDGILIIGNNGRPLNIKLKTNFYTVDKSLIKVENETPSQAPQVEKPFVPSPRLTKNEFVNQPPKFGYDAWQRELEKNNHLRINVINQRSIEAVKKARIKLLGNAAQNITIAKPVNNFSSKEKVDTVKQARIKLMGQASLIKPQTTTAYPATNKLSDTQKVGSLMSTANNIHFEN